MRQIDDTGGHEDNVGEIKYVTINHESNEGDFNSKVYSTTRNSTPRTRRKRRNATRKSTVQGGHF